MFPRKRNCQAWMSAMGKSGNRFLKNTRVTNCLQKFQKNEKEKERCREENFANDFKRKMYPCKWEGRL